MKLADFHFVLASVSLAAASVDAQDKKYGGSSSLRATGVATTEANPSAKQEYFHVSTLVDDEELLADTSSSQESCATFYMYDEESTNGCSGKAAAAFIFTTDSKRNKDCLNNHGSPFYGIGNQYCNPSIGIFHETIYPFSGTCKVHWYDSWSVQELSIAVDTCLGSSVQVKCAPGPCDLSAEEEEENIRQVHDILVARGVVSSTPLIRVENFANTD